MKLFKRFSGILLTAALILALSLNVFAADSSVIYEGGAEKYVFTPDSDLFQNFKGCMPGDVLTQKITVKNELSGKYTVRIYLRAIPHDEEENPIATEVAELETIPTMTDFLSQLYLTVKNGDEVIYEASPDELDGLQNNVLLGTFAKGEGTELTCELTVPADLGNEYSYRAGEVDWVFTAEEIPIVDPVGPKTGDESALAVSALLLLTSAAALTLLARRKVQ